LVIADETEIKISKKYLDELKQWFFKYVQIFDHNDKNLRENVILKEKHTLRVCKAILNIGEQLNINNEKLRLAEIIALFHDIGRFEQYVRYKTFVDRDSENHAELGVKILKEEKVLNRFTESTQSLIQRTILYHNRIELPKNETTTCLFFSKLLRDADKLDIWKVVTDYYQRNNGERNNTIELGLPDTEGFSDEIYQDLLNRQIVKIKNLKNLNDFKLLQVGWIFDINFAPTFQILQERQYLQKIRQALPESKKIDTVFQTINTHLEEKIEITN